MAAPATAVAGPRYGAPMTLLVALEPVGQRADADGGDPDRKPGPLGVAHAVETGATAALCGRSTDELTAGQTEWPGGQGRFALCPRCETSVRTSGD